MLGAVIGGSVGPDALPHGIATANNDKTKHTLTNNFIFKNSIYLWRGTQ